MVLSHAIALISPLDFVSMISGIGLGRAAWKTLSVVTVGVRAGRNVSADGLKTRDDIRAGSASAPSKGTTIGLSSPSPCLMNSKTSCSRAMRAQAAFARDIVGYSAEMGTEYERWIFVESEILRADPWAARETSRRQRGNPKQGC